MKKLMKFPLTALAVAGTLFFTSCGKDDDPAPVDPSNNPTITVDASATTGTLIKVSATSYTVSSGATLRFSWDAREGSKNLNNFNILKDNVQVTGTTLGGNRTLPYNINATLGSDRNRYRDSIDIAFAATSASGSFKFSIKDTDNKEGLVTITVTVKDATTLSNETTSGVINNLQGPNNSAWDLVANASKGISAPAAERDMQETSIAVGNPPTIPFRKEFRSENSTRFVKVSSTYASITTNLLAEGAYLSGTPVQLVTNVANGDVYIAKIRGQETYAVIEITSVVETTGDNLDRIEFKYKK